MRNSDIPTEARDVFSRRAKLQAGGHTANHASRRANKWKDKEDATDSSRIHTHT